METTRLSSKGQVIIPRAVRQAHGWEAGLEFTVEDVGDGILLRPRRRFPATNLADVVGSVGYEGPPLSLNEMTEGVAERTRRSR